MTTKIKWTKELLHLEALKYNTRSELRANNPKAYKSIVRNKMYDVFSHMLRRHKSWSNDDLYKEAQKYNSKIEFKTLSGSAYQTAKFRGILDIVCSNLIQNNKWTLEKLKNEASKYKTRREFQTNSSPSYAAALRNGQLDQVCLHMEKSTNISVPEKALFDAIKKEYPKTQQLKDRKVSISNKPHIKGFDIDIYVPELRKGIEFDGDYWHSLEGLKRSRPTWSNEDLEIYHKLKDEHFKSKGIEILHIKEEDWLHSKEDCLKICLEFLGFAYE
jgi:hypothetical protein